MMAIKFECLNCGSVTSCKDEKTRKKIKCYCGSTKFKKISTIKEDAKK